MTAPGLPLLAITMGDPAGIGPEVALKALAAADIAEACRFVVIGDAPYLQQVAQRAGLAWQICAVSAEEFSQDRPRGMLAVLDQRFNRSPSWQVGVVSAVGGEAAVRAVNLAADLAQSGAVDGIVTAPLNKEAMRLAGYAYDGHTELLAERTGASDVCMMLAGERLRVAHVTGHRSLRDAAVCPSVARLQRVVELTSGALQRLGIAQPRIAVAGLNPHAGEGGLFGDDEVRVLAPAVAAIGAAMDQTIVSGPYPPDSVFRRAAAGEFDAVIAMYHDQGHIPIKMIEFDSAVNVTLGLPIVRTSPDHGTAFDIAGEGIANPANMIAAIRLAAVMTRQRGPRTG